MKWKWSAGQAIEAATIEKAAKVAAKRLAKRHGTGIDLTPARITGLHESALIPGVCRDYIADVRRGSVQFSVAFTMYEQQGSGT